MDQALPVLPAHREDRAGLDGDDECLPRGDAEADDVFSDDQMASAGDRQEFGQSLDNAEQQGFEREQPVQYELRGARCTMVRVHAGQEDGRIIRAAASGYKEAAAYRW